MNSQSTSKRTASNVTDSDEGSSTDSEQYSSPELVVPTATSEQELASLRSAIHAKMQQQVRGRVSHGASTGPFVHASRVSPIKEEVSPPEASPGGSIEREARSLDYLRTLSTDSTASTESQRTVRGGTRHGNETPMRTPSYPFPYVPGTPRSWSTGFHQPFTTLSPTVTGVPKHGQDTPGRTSSGLVSSMGGPSPSAAFLPPGDSRHSHEDPRYPSPNIYDLSLELQSDIGTMEEWWAKVTNILHDHFKAERASLIVPSDSTDIENTTWGQKATFNMAGREEFVPHSTVMAQTAQAMVGASDRPEFLRRENSTDAVRDVRPQKLHPERLRPRLEARHSYAGHMQRSSAQPQSDKDAAVSTSGTGSKSDQRPPGPKRFSTHAAGMGLPTLPKDSSHTSHTPSDLRHTSLSDPDFSSVAGGVDAGPYADVFPIIRSIDREFCPLIEASGVSRVLHRGRVVTVIRDYKSDSSDSSSGQTTAAPLASKQEKLFGNYRGVFASDNAIPSKRDYEEYEQHPTSPWAQSPAPSPAIQVDEDRNPFFPSEEQLVEDSFNPAISPKDYSQLAQVEAIGIDHASTVLHIPLVHPSLSQPMQSLQMSQPSKDKPGYLQRSNTIDLQRKAPIAILSVLTPVVPYPHNLVHSLKLLGPHLATSQTIAQQLGSFRTQVVKIRHRIPAPGEAITNAPMTVELAPIRMANTGLRSGSDFTSETMTSPSEYSMRSKNSAFGSLPGTPGWDSAVNIWGRSMSGTPSAGSGDKEEDVTDSFKRYAISSQSGMNAPTPSKPAKRLSASEGRASGPFSVEETGQQGQERSSKQALGQIDEGANTRFPLGRTSSSAMPAKTVRPSMTHLPDFAQPKHHSLLHSYGADFESSFGELPTADYDESRKMSLSENMPPPSERLLRLIIDSVPVQIFTAEPETGHLTWVNGKVAGYRGQDAREVVKDPWQAIHPDEREEFTSIWRRSLRTNQQMSQKVRMQNSEGSYRWFFVRCLPLKNVQQKVVHWIGTMMDFHEQHMAELSFARAKEAEASQAKYKALANSSPQIVFSAQKTQGITFCNTQWLQYSGQTEKDTLGQGFLGHVHPDDLVKCRFPLFEEGSNLPVNVPTSLPVEPKRTLSASVTSTSGSSDTVTGADAAASSTTQTPQIMPQRKLAELASTGILKVTRDADGRPSYSTEVRLKSKDGEYRWFLVRVVLAEPANEGDHQGMWYGTCTDINDHKTLEKDLKETMDEKSRFLSNMSHEIRTPLNGITGMVNFLMDSNLSSEQMEHVNIIRSSTEGLRGLINDILDLSKAEAGMISLNYDWLYPRALIEEVNDLASTMAIDKGLQLNYLVEEDVPAVFKGDKFRIRQILLNIVGNAIKFTQKGEVFVRCSRQADEDDELKGNEIYIRYDIIDTGRGFNDQEAEFLFKRFSQIDGSSTRQHGGTGLGLVISRQLAQLHGGDMGATSVPEQGSTFTFFIKAVLASDDDRPPPQTLEVPNQIPIVAISEQSEASVSSASSAKKSSPQVVAQSAKAQSPVKLSSPDTRKDSSPTVSSAGSELSVRSTVTRSGSAHSTGSSASSFVPDAAVAAPSMKLSLPNQARRASASHMSSSLGSNASKEPMKGTHLSPITSPAPMFSILVVAPLKYSREATVHHIDKTLPKNVPHTITARTSLDGCQDLLSGSNAVTFTHIVLVLEDVQEIIALMTQVFKSSSTTSIVLITDLAQRRQVSEQATNIDCRQLIADHRLIPIFKPLKPSRLGLIFDPQKEREMSLDRNQDSAQQVASTQKMVFEELKTRLGKKKIRVLLVEDNKVNQLVILKFFAKASIKVETVLDGVQCTDKIFASPPNSYSMILCDLHMPNKDGYQTCREIRDWERKNGYSMIPIIALSANVLGDVYQKCVESGFNDYLTKPVEFKELGNVLLNFMDNKDPTKIHELMKMRSGPATSVLRPTSSAPR